jgi:hypothetical protein
MARQFSTTYGARAPAMTANLFNPVTTQKPKNWWVFLTTLISRKIDNYGCIGDKKLGRHYGSL